MPARVGKAGRSIGSGPPVPPTWCTTTRDHPRGGAPGSSDRVKGSYPADSRVPVLPTTIGTAAAGRDGQEAHMARLQVVADPDVPLHLLADRLRQVGHWVPPEALEQAIDAAFEASPPMLLV